MFRSTIPYPLLHWVHVPLSLMARPFLARHPSRARFDGPPQTDRLRADIGLLSREAEPLRPSALSISLRNGI